MVPVGVGREGRHRPPAPAVNSRLTAALAGLVALTGLAPVAIAVVTGVLVGEVPDAVGAGFDSDAGRRALAALGLLFLVLQTAAAARAAPTPSSSPGEATTPSCTPFRPGRTSRPE